MTSTKVSIIVPMFNAEDTLHDSIQSAICQTLNDVEVICIDNNSTDNSVGIVKKMQKKDHRIKLLYEKAQGAGPARNKGISEAVGRYVFFLDPDDSIYADDTLERLFNLAEKHDVSIAGGSACIVDAITGKSMGGEEKYSFQSEGIKEYKDYQFDWGFWRFLYRRDFLQKNNITFPSYLRGQDTVFFVKAMIKAKKFYALVESTYQYNYKHSKKKHSKESYEDYEKANLDVVKLAKKNNLPELERQAQGHRLPLVSVIIPVYNVESYLAECVSSVQNQTYQNIEIILVDDKTPDASGEMADELAKKDNRIKVIHKPKNEGLNMARATGFKASTGDYVTFVDSDDMLVKYVIEASIQELVKGEVDFVRFDTVSFRDEDDLKEKLKKHPQQATHIIDNKKDLYRTQFSGLPGRSMLMCVWGAVYPRRLVEKINWLDSNYRIYEDNIWTLRFLEHANSCKYLDMVGYLYRNDHIITDVLSKKVTGNSYNGRNVGYLEFLYIHINEMRRYNKKYNIGADSDIDNFAKNQWRYRLQGLVENNAFGAENNIEYLGEALRWAFKDYDELTVQNAQRQEHVESLQARLSELHGVKRSLKLVAGNLKRRVKKLLVG